MMRNMTETALTAHGSRLTAHGSYVNENSQKSQLGKTAEFSAFSTFNHYSGRNNQSTAALSAPRTPLLNSKFNHRLHGLHGRKSVTTSGSSVATFSPTVGIFAADGSNFNMTVSKSNAAGGNFNMTVGNSGTAGGKSNIPVGNFNMTVGNSGTTGGKSNAAGSNKINVFHPINTTRRHIMAKTSDWLPASRQGQLNMIKDWKTVCTAKTGAWNIPAAALTELDALTQAAQSALDTAQNETTRTPVATAQCKTAFDALAAFMRDTKKRYFLSPPLQDADYVSLGLKSPDHTPTPSGTPTAQAMVETFLLGRHELGIKIVYVTGNANESANKGYRIWYDMSAPGEAPPANPEDLRKSFFTKRKKDVIEFDFDASGKTAYFAVQIENGGKKGPWGPVVSALIP